jgi:hypothetical protein
MKRISEAIGKERNRIKNVKVSKDVKFYKKNL